MDVHRINSVTVLNIGPCTKTENEYVDEPNLCIKRLSALTAVFFLCAHKIGVNILGSKR